MITVVTLINALIFALLAGLHFYWMIGGKWGLVESLPRNTGGGELVDGPGPISCLLVGLGLLGSSLYNVSLAFGFSLNLPLEADLWAIWLLAIIFTFRAIGDFHYVGMFKKVTNTKFAKMDTKLHIPLSLYLGLSSAWIGWSNFGS